MARYGLYHHPRGPSFDASHALGGAGRQDLSLQYRVTEESRFRQQLLERMQAEAKQRRDSSDFGAGDEEEKAEGGGSESGESHQAAEDIPSLFRGIPAPYSHPEDFQRVIITSDGEKPDPERAEVRHGRCGARESGWRAT